MPDWSQDAISLERLRDAVTRGIISPDQLQALCALDHEGAAPPAAPVEVRRGLNAVTLAYGLGAAAVLTAFGWVLVDRWQVLGPAGILAVTLVYALIFAGASRFVGRLGFRTASAIAALLAVSMTPLVTWCLLKLSGWWDAMPVLTVRYAPGDVDVLVRLRALPLQLATVLAALVTLRRVRFSLLALPVVAMVPMIVDDLVPLLVPSDVARDMSGWGAFVSGILLISVGYLLERRSRDDEDYARWAYLTGLVTLAWSVMMVWNWSGGLRHGLPILAIGLFTLSLYLRRPTFAVFGALGIVGYLAYLAFDVFRSALGFPVVMASFGIAVIVLTVWAQRRYPALMQRMSARHAGRTLVPNDVLVFGGAVAIALVLAISRVPAARVHTADVWARRQQELDARARQQRLKADSARATRQPPAAAAPVPVRR